MLKYFKIKPEELIKAIWSCDTQVMTASKIQTLLGLPFFGSKKE